ncbi:hypothetical protein ACH5RR_006818 [Cinchona calisaya]|uniref:Uncharacterized protein n=1 Tax=Cinchona calisaya TaxID=153742 RepID=A0ABD3AQ26_9GENT
MKQLEALYLIVGGIPYWKACGMVCQLQHGLPDKIVAADNIEKALRCLMDTESPVRKRVKRDWAENRKASMNGGSSFISLGRYVQDILVDK